MAIKIANPRNDQTQPKAEANDRTNEGTNKQTDERTNERTIAVTNERKNERTAWGGMGWWGHAVAYTISELFRLEMGWWVTR